MAGLYESYEFDDVARLLYRFVWNEVCDWYLEVAKVRLYSEDENERLQVSGNLLVLLEHVMLLLHPLMPFVTEEIYGYLPQVASGERPAGLFDARYPESRPEWADPAAEAAMEAFTIVVAGLRSAREELGLARDVLGRVTLIESEPGAAAAIVSMSAALRHLTGCELVAVVADSAAPSGRSASIPAAGVRALLDLEGLVDVERERERLVAKAKKATVEAGKAGAKLANPGFVAKAPEEVVTEERDRLAAAEWLLDEVRRQYRERIGEEMPMVEKAER